MDLTKRQHVTSWDNSAFVLRAATLIYTILKTQGARSLDHKNSESKYGLQNMVTYISEDIIILRRKYKLKRAGMRRRIKMPSFFTINSKPPCLINSSNFLERSFEVPRQGNIISNLL